MRNWSPVTELWNVSYYRISCCGKNDQTYRDVDIETLAQSIQPLCLSKHRFEDVYFIHRGCHAVLLAFLSWAAFRKVPFWLLWMSLNVLWVLIAYFLFKKIWIVVSCHVLENPKRDENAWPWTVNLPSYFYRTRCRFLPGKCWQFRFTTMYLETLKFYNRK